MAIIFGFQPNDTGSNPVTRSKKLWYNTRMPRKKIKNYILPGTTLLASFYASFIFGFGIIIGYIFSNVFVNKLIHKGRIKRVVLDHKGYYVYFHHWIIGLAMLLFGFITQIIYTAPIIIIGCIGGIILHDLYTDDEWFRVVVKKNVARK